MKYHINLLFPANLVYKNYRNELVEKVSGKSDRKEIKSFFLLYHTVGLSDGLLYLARIWY